MDFLSTPLPTSSGTEEICEKKQYGWSKGIKQDSAWKQKRTQPRRFFQGKTISEWQAILGGDLGTIRDHIKNGTIETYRLYRLYLGLKSMKNKHFVKKIMTPKGVMTYEEAKKAFGWSQAETVRNRVRSEDYPNWYEIKEAQE